ncbi:MAG: FAD:protein FMN transferase [Pseudomonadales bacterium]
MAQPLNSAQVARLAIAGSWRSPGTLWLAALLGLALSGCEAERQYQSYSGQTMGTYYRVTCDCAPGQAVLDSELQNVNRQMSNYDEQSDLSRINRAPVGEWQPLGADLYQVLDYAARVYELSAGAFDITVAPVLALWGFGPDAGPLEQQPDPATLQEAARRVDGAAVRLRTEPAAVRREQDVMLDLSALAKGHGVDRVATRLEELGCEHFLVDIGGEVRAQGLSPQQRAWRVGVEVPDAQSRGSVARVVHLRNQAIATSGDYRNFIELAGSEATDTPQRWSHTIDPRTAQPVRHTLASVSVLAATAMQADALATALNVLGPEAGYTLAQQQGLAVLFIERTAQGYQQRYTPAFEDALEP